MKTHKCTLQYQTAVNNQTGSDKISHVWLTKALVLIYFKDYNNKNIVVSVVYRKKRKGKARLFVETLFFTRSDKKLT